MPRRSTPPAGALSRRSLLKGAGVAAAVLSSRRLLAEDAPIRLGSGTHTYEWVKGWGRLSQGMTYGNTHGCVAVDSKGRIFVNTDTENAVIIFEPDGTFVASWGKDFKGGAHGMAIFKEGDDERMFMGHIGRHEAIKLTLDGKVLMTLPFPKEAGVYAKPDEYKPTSVAVAPNGDVYVGDGYGKSWVHRYNAKGEYVQSWDGSKGAPGKLSTPHGVWIDTRGEKPVVLVADRSNHRLQIFSLEGESLGEVKEGLRFPCHACVRDGDVLVPDLSGRVTILDKNNKLIAHLGEGSHPKKGANDFPKKDWKDGEFTAPHCACWDAKGDMYVMDWNYAGRVSKLKRVAS